jgi:hypothetical protein
MRRASAVVGGVAAVALAAGCSGGGKSDQKAWDVGLSGKIPSSNVVMAALSKTATAKTARLTERGSTQIDTGKPLQQTASGVVDLTNGTGSITATSPFGGGKIEIVFAGGTIYEKLPKDLAKLLKVDKPWAKISFSQEASNNGAANPLQFLTSLQGVADSITRVGGETVEGTATTHYKVTIDLEEAAKRAGALGSSIKDVADMTGTKQMPADVWVDGRGRLRKLSVKMHLRIAGKTLTSTQDVELSDYGTPVHVNIPSADQTDEIG